MLWSWCATGGAAPDALAPVRWLSGAYIGDGLRGAMVTAVVDAATNATPALRIDLGRTDVWSCEQRDTVGFFTVAPAGGASVKPCAAVRRKVHEASSQSQRSSSWKSSM